MFCPECGSNNPDDADFCSSCGNSLNNAPQPTPESPEPVARIVDLDPTQTKVSSGLKWGVLAASLLVPLIGIIMGVFYMLKGENEDKQAVGRLWLFASIGISFFYFLIGSGEFG